MKQYQQDVQDSRPNCAGVLLIAYWLNSTAATGDKEYANESCGEPAGKACFSICMYCRQFLTELLAFFLFGVLSAKHASIPRASHTSSMQLSSAGLQPVHNPLPHELAKLRLYTVCSLAGEA
jgi:hypothetical protein